MRAEHAVLSALCFVCYRSLKHLSSVYTRRYRLVDSAVEMFFAKGAVRSLFADFGVTRADIERRNDFMRALNKVSPAEIGEAQVTLPFILGLYCSK